MTSLVALYDRTVRRLGAMVPDAFLLLIARLGIAAVFFQSGRTKVDGILHITDGTYELFRTDYALPFIPPQIAAVAAAYSEHIFSILLVLGLATRFSASVFFLMTLTIEIFVYPDAWPTHLSWAAILLPLIARGGGRLVARSSDRDSRRLTTGRKLSPLSRPKPRNGRVWIGLAAKRIGARHDVC